LAAFGEPRIADVGLSFAQAFELGVEVRRTGPTRDVPLGPGALDDGPLLASGYYAHLEALPPAALLRWAYERVARGAEEHGFG
jgi:hypothetical protein